MRAPRTTPKPPYKQRREMREWRAEMDKLLEARKRAHAKLRAPGEWTKVGGTA